MSLIERGSIRIENDRIVADGSGEDEGRQFIFEGGNEVIRSLSETDYDLWLNILDGKVKEFEINGKRLIVGPEVFDARGLPGKNQHGVSISKRKGIGFYSWNPPGYWRR